MASSGTCSIICICQSSPKNKRSCLSSVGRSSTSLHYFLLVSPKCTSTPAKQCSLSPASCSVHKADCSYPTNTSNHTQIFQRSLQFFHYAATTLHTHTHTVTRTHRNVLSHLHFIKCLCALPLNRNATVLFPTPTFLFFFFSLSPCRPLWILIKSNM